ncbi:myoneurin [Protopterus annectens]|uniref:myoneurin n=1 Tax=Protopterus annectens TaxID=7888 RepID=UPI001CFB15D4|nr:myoneurin [Protopterus annectens]
MQQSYHSKHLLEQLNKQQESGFLCDCTVLLGESQFRAHRNVLAAFSEYFGAFYMATSENNVFLDQSQVKPEAFQKLLEFIYTGDINLDSCNVGEIHQAASYLKVEDLVSKCKMKLDTLNVTLACSYPELMSSDAHDELNKHVCLFPVENHEDQKDLEMFNINEVQSAPEEGMIICSLSQEKAGTTKKSSRNSQNNATQHRKNGITNVVLQQNFGLSVHSDETFLDTSKEPVDSDQTKHWANDLEPQVIIPVSAEDVSSQDIVVQNRTGKQRQRRLQKSQGPKQQCTYNATNENIMQSESSINEELGDLRLKSKPTCNTCGKVFSEASSLRRHVRIHKGVKPYICHLCEKAFTQCNQLKTHVRTHTGERPYQCDLCDKGFAQKCQLVFHCRMHHGEEKPYKCDVCNLKFATSSNLKIHSRKHSGEKPYECDRCGQRFAQASTLTYHVRRHTGEKPYICDTCGKAFVVSSSLITHERKHTGERPYICGICGKRFISSGELTKHFRSHTGERPFICELCGFSYTDVKNLKKHKAKVHEAAPERNVNSDAVTDSYVEQESLPKSPLQDSADLKPDISLPLIPIGTEDHQMLLPVSDNQSVSSEALRRSSLTGYSEPQFIFLQQLY